MGDDTFHAALRRLRAERHVSLRELARLTHIDSGHLSKIENGHRPAPTRDLVKAIDQALGAGGALIALGEAERAQRMCAISRGQQSGHNGSNPATRTFHVDWDDQDPPSAGAAHADPEWSEVLRRAVIKGTATIAALQLIGLRSRDLPVDHLSLDLVHGLAAVAAQYRRAYHSVPASKLLPAALAHLELVISLRPASRRDGERISLVTVTGEMATLAGVLLALDAARYNESLSFLDMAWNAARSVEDIDMQSVVLGCRSFALAYGGGDHRAGLDCADFGRALAATGASTETRAWVAAVASERAASLNDLSGSQERLDESRLVLDSPDESDKAWRGIGGYDAAKLRAYEGGNMMRLNRYRQAEGLLDDALDQLDLGMSRHRATALLDRAEARLGQGAIDAACSDASKSLALVAHLEHTGHLDRIGRIAARGVSNGAAEGRHLLHEVQLARLDHGLQLERQSR